MFFRDLDFNWVKNQDDYFWVFFDSNIIKLKNEKKILVIRKCDFSLRKQKDSKIHNSLHHRKPLNMITFTGNICLVIIFQ